MEYQLPCRSPWDHWQSPLQDKFLIGAWWPPTLNVINQYVAAHFNYLDTGNIASGCQANGTIPNPATYDDAFGCIMNQLPLFKELGLMVGYDVGFFNNSLRFQDMFYGGADNMGGLTDYPFGDGPVKRKYSQFTVPELKWAMERLRNHSLEDGHLHTVMVRDDVVTNNRATLDVVNFLREHWPQLLPITNTGAQGPDTLYAQLQPMYTPEQYMISGATTNATRATNEQLALLADSAMVTERFRLSPWGLFNVGDGGQNPVLYSPSLARVQAYGAVAYGSRGLYYYCWGNGIWTLPSPDQTSGPGTPGAIYETVKRSNADLSVWGQLLMAAQHVGAMRRPSVPFVSPGGEPGATDILEYGNIGDHSTLPAPTLPVVAMDNQLLVGASLLNVSGEDGDGYLMVVDLRTETLNATTAPTLGPRTVTLVLHPECTPTIIEGHSEGWSANVASRHAWRPAEHRLSLGLEAGGGALVRIAGCTDRVRAVRQWHQNPRAISLRPPDATWQCPQMSPRVADFNYNGAAERNAVPGGWAGWQSNFLIGGSFWEASRAFADYREAEAWAQAGFNVASLAADPAVLSASLPLSAAFGVLVLPSTQRPKVAAAMPKAAIKQSVADFGCHPNFGGLVLGDGASEPLTVGDAAAALRAVGYMFLPLVPAVPTVGAAVTLAGLGAPLAAVSLPQRMAGAMAGAQPAAVANAVLSRLAELRAAAANSSNAMTMAVTLSACDTTSDSFTRFAAYASVIWGAQALWWEGVGACAPIGTDEWAMISSINRRLSQWAEPLFGNAKDESTYGYGGGGSGRPWNVTRYVVDQVWSTSSLELPPLQGVAARPPTVGELVEGMDEELIVIHLVNASGAPPARTRALLVLSTSLSSERGGAPVRQLAIQMRSDVTSTKPIEPDFFQGWGAVPGFNGVGEWPQGVDASFFGRAECDLSFGGGKMPLQLAGGSAQLVTYTMWAATTASPPRDAPGEEERVRQIGRRPLRRASARGGAASEV